MTAKELADRLEAAAKPSAFRKRNEGLPDYAMALKHSFEGGLMLEAAAMLRRMDDALEPFAAYADTWHEIEPNWSIIVEGYEDDPNLTLEQFRAAKSALLNGNER